MAEEVSYDVVVTDPDIAKFSGIVNSCDVLMRVHGSALNNMVFLLGNAAVIQQMKLNDMEYSINDEETTLSELCPGDHAIFKVPKSLHPQKADWDTFSRIFLKEQNVKLDVR
ncbi:alpha-1,3-arabinosyltransferase XAT2-like [Musa acuminata AAA Group]|uniref:alpha-1,3-arabinosyltransferase XAT2-like n=1 Tax=Musa acuminata AAA Group TaxID=214697 RepID=UPI0031D78BC1